jgi:hypothetical protein
MSAVTPGQAAREAFGELGADWYPGTPWSELHDDLRAQWEAAALAAVDATAAALRAGTEPTEHELAAAAARPEQPAPGDVEPLPQHGELRMILARCPVHAGMVHAQVGDDDEWFCLRDLADTAESAQGASVTAPAAAPRAGQQLPSDLAERAGQAEEQLIEAEQTIDSYRELITGVERERNGAYRERARLVAYLAACYPSEIVEQAGQFADEWPVIFVDTPAGQLSWHLSRADLDLFSHVRAFIGESPWDGHTTEEKYERLAELIPHATDTRILLIDAKRETSTVRNLLDDFTHAVIDLDTEPKIIAAAHAIRKKAALPALGGQP